MSDSCCATLQVHQTLKKEKKQTNLSSTEMDLEDSKQTKNHVMDRWYEKSFQKVFHPKECQ